MKIDDKDIPDFLIGVINTYKPLEYSFDVELARLLIKKKLVELVGKDVALDIYKEARSLNTSEYKYLFGESAESIEIPDEPKPTSTRGL